MLDAWRILLVDANPHNRQLIKHILEKEAGGYRLTEAGTPAEFEMCLTTGGYDLVLADLNLDGYTGLQILDTIQARYPGIPVVIVTDTGSAEIAVEALKRGVADYITTTPGHIRRLPQIIKTVLENKRLVQEETLAQAQLHFHATILQNVNAAIHVTDMEGRIIYWNSGAEAIFGYTAAEMLGQTPAVLYPTQNPAEFTADLQQILAGQSFLGEWQGRCKDGSIVWVDQHTTVMRDTNGDVVGCIGVSKDISRRKRLEVALQQSQAHYHSLLESAQNFVIFRNQTVLEDEAQGRNIFVSPSIKDVMGVSDPGNFETWFRNIHPDDLPAVLKNQHESAQQNIPFNQVMRIYHPGKQEWRWIQAISHPVHDKTNGHTYFDGIIIDITGQKQAEAAKEQYTHRLETLRQIDRDILAARSPADIAAAALRRLAHLIPCRRAGVDLIDFERQTLQKIAIYPQTEAQLQSGDLLPLSETNLNIAALRLGEIYQVEDYLALPHLSPQLQAVLSREGVRASLILPMIAADELVGVMGVGLGEPGRIPPGQIEIMREVADQLAIAIQQAMLLEAEREQRLLAQALSDTARDLNSTLDREQILDRILVNAGRVVPNEGSEILLIDAAGVVTIARHQGYAERSLADWANSRHFLLQDFPALADIAKNKTPQVIADTYRYSGWVFVPQTNWICSYVCAPILVAQQLVGFIGLSHTIPGFYQAAHAKRLQSFAEQAGFALHNARLYEQVQRHAGELEQRVAERTAELREQYRQQAANEERQRLARDLHDAVSQTLFSASLMAEAIPRLWTRYPQKAAQSLEELARLNRGALAEMRTLLLELRPAALAEAGMGELLRQLTHTVAGRTQLEISLQIAGEHVHPAEIHIVFYRIAQEAFNNITKHAHATQVTVNFNSQPNGMVLAIKDNGRGFEPKPELSGRLGLTIMSERAETIGARLQIISEPGQGAEIVVVWPRDLQNSTKVKP